MPASIIAIVVATALTAWLAWDVMTIGALPGVIPSPRLPILDTATTSALFSAALAVAALAAIESLLSARVADGMSDGSRLNPDRELFGQGLANVASGLFGGMPATGAIARTAVNVRAGARTRVSAIVHSVLILADRPVRRVPGGPYPAGGPRRRAHGDGRAHGRPSVRDARSSHRRQSDALVMILTATATVVFDLILAVEIGIAVAAVLALRAMAKSSTVEQEEVSFARARSRSATTRRSTLCCASTSRSTVWTVRSSSARPSTSSTSSPASRTFALSSSDWVASG